MKFIQPRSCFRECFEYCNKIIATVSFGIHDCFIKSGIIEIFMSPNQVDNKTSETKNTTTFRCNQQQENQSRVPPHFERAREWLQQQHERTTTKQLSFATDTEKCTSSECAKMEATSDTNIVRVGVRNRYEFNEPRSLPDELKGEDDSFVLL